MGSREMMMNVMADIIGVDDTFSGDRLNEEAVWQKFMSRVFKRMDAIEDEDIRSALSRIDTKDFQQWIDDPGFWREINDEITRRGQVLKTLMPSDNQGTC